MNRVKACNNDLAASAMALLHGGKDRSNSWPMPPSAMEEMNLTIHRAVQEQVAAQMRAISPMLAPLAAQGPQPMQLSLNNTEISFYEPGKTPPASIKPENVALPELSPEPLAFAERPVADAVNQSPVLGQPHSAPAVVSILQNSPTLAPTAFVLPVNMEDESDSDDEMF